MIKAAKFILAGAVLIVTACSSSPPECCHPSLTEECTHHFKRIPELISWKLPAKPMSIAGPISFVGTQGLGVWLVEATNKCPKEYILINTGTKSSGRMIEKSLNQMGVRLSQIRILLANHAHVDHVGGHAYIQKKSGAKVMLMTPEDKILASGGRADPIYGSKRLLRFDAVTCVEPLRDGQEIRLGKVTLTAIRTAGHSPGATTFIMDITGDNGKKYKVVFPDGTGINPNYRLTGEKASYPGIKDNYTQTFKILKGLENTVDIWLAPHLSFFDFKRKRALAEQAPCGQKTQPWVDREGYQRWLQQQHQAFQNKLCEEGQASHDQPACRCQRR